MVTRPPELFLPAALNHVCHFWQLYIGPACRAICMHCRQAPRSRGEGFLHVWTNIHDTPGSVNTSRNTSNSTPCRCGSSSAGMKLPLLISTHKQLSSNTHCQRRQPLECQEVCEAGTPGCQCRHRSTSFTPLLQLSGDVHVEPTERLGQRQYHF